MQLQDDDPAIAHLALWCDHRDAAGSTRTAGTTILYGEDFGQLSLAERVGVAAHHVLHVTLRHSELRTGLAQRLGPAFEEDLFDLAADTIVNEVLLAAGHALPRPAARLSELLEHLPGASRDGCAGLTDWSTERLYFRLASRDENDQGRSAREARAYARAVGHRPDIVSAEQSGDREPIAAAEIQAAAERGRVAGIGVGAILARLIESHPSRIPWEIELRRLLTRSLSEFQRRSHRRPARHWLALDAAARWASGPRPAFQPGFSRDRRRARIVVGLDTSSSVTKSQLGLFTAETIGIAERTGAEVHCLVFDTAVTRHVEKVDRATMLATEFVTGGGTDFTAVIGAAERLEPSLLVLMTDLEGAPGPAPKIPVLWAVPRAPKPSPPFGRVLIME